MEQSPQQNYKLPEFPSYVKWVDRLIRNWWATPLLALLGTGILYMIDFGRESQQASAQQAPSRAWTREDSLIAKILRENPRELCAQRGQYFLTSLAASTLASEELGRRYFLKEITGKHLPVVVTEQDILEEAARMGGDEVITSEEIIASYRELTKEYRHVIPR